jgi:hypothetical protein
VEYQVLGPWLIDFPVSRGEPGTVQFDSLAYWNENPDDGIKFFSFIVTYKKEFTLPEEFVGQGKRIFLEFENIIEVACFKTERTGLGHMLEDPLPGGY